MLTESTLAHRFSRIAKDDFLWQFALQGLATSLMGWIAEATADEAPALSLFVNGVMPQRLMLPLLEALPSTLQMGANKKKATIWLAPFPTLSTADTFSAFTALGSTACVGDSVIMVCFGEITLAEVNDGGVDCADIPLSVSSVVSQSAHEWMSTMHLYDFTVMGLAVDQLIGEYYSASRLIRDLATYGLLPSRQDSEARKKLLSQFQTFPFSGSPAHRNGKVRFSILTATLKRQERQKAVSTAPEEQTINFAKR